MEELMKLGVERIKFWFQKTSKVPLKAKIVLWLDLSNKLLTRDNFFKRDWIGPSWCPLCHLNEESSSHLFINWSYANFVWDASSTTLNASAIDKSTLLVQRCLQWWKDLAVGSYETFPYSFIYGIWWSRNATIFQNRLIPQAVKTTLVVQWSQEFKQEKKAGKQWLLVQPNIEKYFPWAFFDGASQGELPLGSSGGVIFLSEESNIKIRFSPGHCSNNKAKLAALWAVLKVALSLGITKL